MDTRTLTKVTLFLLILVIAYIVNLKIDFDMRLKQQEMYYKEKIQGLKKRDDDIVSAMNNNLFNFNKVSENVRGIKTMLKENTVDFKK